MPPARLFRHGDCNSLCADERSMSASRLVDKLHMLMHRATGSAFLERVPLRWRLWTKQFLRDWALTVVLGVVALLACAKLGEDVFSHETGTFDDAIQWWVDN